MVEEYTPPDNDVMTRYYKKSTGGCCGQACLAVITKAWIRNVLIDWQKELGFEWKGWSGFNQLKKYLEKKGFTVKLKKKEELLKKEGMYIARVQWVGDGLKKQKPFYEGGHWSEASSHTHFIVIEKERFFCNESGWDTLSNLRDYLTRGDGLITSYLEITGNHGNKDRPS